MLKSSNALRNKNDSMQRCVIDETSSEVWNLDIVFSFFYIFCFWFFESIVVVDREMEMRVKQVTLVLCGLQTRFRDRNTGKNER